MWQYKVGCLVLKDGSIGWLALGVWQEKDRPAKIFLLNFDAYHWPRRASAEDKRKLRDAVVTSRSPVGCGLVADLETIMAAR